MPGRLADGRGERESFVPDDCPVARKVRKRGRSPPPDSGPTELRKFHFSTRRPEADPAEDKGGRLSKYSKLLEKRFDQEWVEAGGGGGRRDPYFTLSAGGPRPNMVPRQDLKQ